MDNHFEITVKNTFVHLSHFPSATCAAAAERRCSSVPSSARLAFTEGEDTKVVASSSSSDRAPSDQSSNSESGEAAARWSDVSTSADSDLESVASSPHPASSSSTKPAAALAVRHPVGKDPRRAPPVNSRSRARHGEESALPSRSSAANGHRRAPAKASTSAAAASAAPSAAPVAAATSAASGAILAPGDLLKQMTIVIAAAASALSGCSYIKFAKTTEGPRGWSIVAKVAAEDAHHKEAALALAREAILQAARESSCVYVLGHRAQPFLITPVGFASSLGSVADESKACWSMINQGFCRKGCACRWEHPACQTTVNVMVQVERPSV